MDSFHFRRNYYYVYLVVICFVGREIYHTFAVTDLSDLRNNIVISFLLQALLLKHYAIMSTMATPHNMSRVLPMAYVTV